MSPTWPVPGTGLLLALLTLLLSACTPAAGPQETASQFGRALIAGGSDRLAKRVRESDGALLDIVTVLMLVRVGNGWRVDYESSVRDISRDSELAKMLAQLQRLGARAGADLNRSFEELQNALPRLASELPKIEKDNRAQVPDDRKAI